MKKVFYFWAHLLVVLALWSSPFWLSWKIILLVILLYYIQLLIFGDCLLIKWRFKTKKRVMTIYTQILEYFGFKPDRKLLVFLSDYIFPWIIFLTAFITQNL